MHDCGEQACSAFAARSRPSCRLPSVGVRLTETTLTEGDDLARRLKGLGLEVRNDQVEKSRAERVHRAGELVILVSLGAELHRNVTARRAAVRLAAVEAD
jgi:hypothetical protein